MEFCYDMIENIQKNTTGENYENWKKKCYEKLINFSESFENNKNSEMNINDDDENDVDENELENYILDEEIINEIQTKEKEQVIILPSKEENNELEDNSEDYFDFFDNIDDKNRNDSKRYYHCPKRKSYQLNNEQNSNEEYMRYRNNHFRFNEYYSNNYFKQNTSNNHSNYYRVYTKEEKEEIFSKVELKNPRQRTESDDWINKLEENISENLQKNIELSLIEFKPIENNEFRTLLLNSEFNIENMEEFVNKKYNFSKNLNEKTKESNNSSLNTTSNLTINNSSNKTFVQTNFSFYKKSKDEDDEDLYENYEINSVSSSKNDKEEVEEEKEEKVDNKSNEFHNFYINCTNFLNSDCFSKEELTDEQIDVYSFCKPGEKYYKTILKCVKKCYYEKHFFKYFSDRFFENVCTIQEDSNEPIFDTNLFNICLMNIVNDNSEENQINKNFFKFYVYLYNFIDEIKVHYYFNEERKDKDELNVTTFNFHNIEKLIDPFNRQYYIQFYDYPDKFMMFLCIWLYVLDEKDLYPSKDAILLNIYHLDFLLTFVDNTDNFEETNKENKKDSSASTTYVYDSDYETDNEPNFEELNSDNESIKRNNSENEDNDDDNQNFAYHQYQIDLNEFSI